MREPLRWIHSPSPSAAALSVAYVIPVWARKGGEIAPAALYVGTALRYQCTAFASTAPPALAGFRRTWAGPLHSAIRIFVFVSAAAAMRDSRGSMQCVFYIARSSRKEIRNISHPPSSALKIHSHKCNKTPPCRSEFFETIARLRSQAPVGRLWEGWSVGPNGAYAAMAAQHIDGEHRHFQRRTPHNCPQLGCHSVAYGAIKAPLRFAIGSPARLRKDFPQIRREYAEAGEYVFRHADHARLHRLSCHLSRA